MVKVIYRMWVDDTGSNVIALFPELPADAQGFYCDSYMRIGQHAAADYHKVLQHTRPATAEESAKIAAELVTIGYELAPRKRATWRDHDIRRERARKGVAA